MVKVGFDLGINGIPGYVVSQLGYDTPDMFCNELVRHTPDEVKETIQLCLDRILDEGAVLPSSWKGASFVSFSRRATSRRTRTSLVTNLSAS